MNEITHNNIGETIIEHRLENGLSIFVFPKPEYQKQFAFFATNYGGMDTKFLWKDKWEDTPEGVAHFLEHKMFDTKDGNALQVLTGNGVSPNAFTSSALTGYYFEGSEAFYENLETLLSFVSVPYFTQESVEKEQGIIGQEIQMIEDNPHWQAYMNTMKGMYKTHPVSHSVAGSKESISQITHETLYLCHEAFYNPSNMVLCIAGDVDAQRVIDVAKSVLPDVPGGVISRNYGNTEPETVNEAYREIEMEVSTPIIQLGFKLKSESDKTASLRQRLLGDILSEIWMGTSSPLYAKLYEKGVINNSFFCGYESYRDCSFLLAGGESREPDAVKEALLEEANRLSKEGIDEELFRRVKKAMYGSRVRMLNSFERLCVEQARGYFAEEDVWIFPEIYATITKEEVESALKSWISEQRISMVVIKPKGDNT